MIMFTCSFKSVISPYGIEGDALGTHWQYAMKFGYWVRICGPIVGYKFVTSMSLPFMENRDPYHRTGFRPGSHDLVLRQPRCNYWIISCFRSISSVRNICSDLCRSSVRKGTMSLTDLSWTSTQFLSELVSVHQFLLVFVCNLSIHYWLENGCNIAHCTRLNRQW